MFRFVIMTGAIPIVNKGKWASHLKNAHMNLLNNNKK